MAPIGMFALFALLTIAVSTGAYVALQRSGQPAPRHRGKGTKATTATPRHLLGYWVEDQR